MTTVLPTLGAVALVAAVMGCSSGSGPSGLLSVGGTYPTVVALVAGQNTCTGVTVQDNPTTVIHTAGGSTIALSHAGTQYDGLVQTSGQFSAGPKTLVVGGVTYVISMTGQFVTRGFTAAITVQAAPGSGPACGYQVSWTGTKQGGDNVIP